MTPVTSVSTHGRLAPSPWIVRFAHLVPVGARVLDLACGEGRHARLFAARGCRVLAVDRDAAALAGLVELANIDTRAADLEAGWWPFGSERFDAIIAVNYLHRPLFAPLLASLAPDGALLYDTFARGNEVYGRPSNPDFLLERDELLQRVAARLTVVAFEQGCVAMKERNAVVQRIAAVGAERRWPPEVSQPIRDQHAHRVGFGARDVGKSPRVPLLDSGSAQCNKVKSRFLTGVLMLTGSIVAIATPLQQGGALDLPGLRTLIDFHVDEGTAGIVIVGTTGESPTVDFNEHCELIRAAVEFAAGRLPVIAGTGANSTREAIELTACAKKVGAASGLSVVPYYNKPTQEGLYRHFRAIAEAVDLPLLLYNVPSRTAADLATDTTLRLADVPGIIGIKDATADLGRGAELLKALAVAGKRSFAVYSGEDITGLPLLFMGGQGVISVTANVAPKLMAKMCAAALAGDLATARECNDRLLPLHRQLFVEANPIPVKWALAEMGLIANELRLPLVPLSPQYHNAVRAALREAGCLK